MKLPSTVMELARRPLRWLPDESGDATIVLCSRVRLARNLLGVPFPGRASPEQRAAVRDRVEQAVVASDAVSRLLVLHVDELEALERQILLERRLISPELCNASVAGAALIDLEESLSVLVNEEDHLRIQVLKPGLLLGDVWERAVAVERAIGAAEDFAFDARLGFLTACPSNVGTGLRASAMLHLPGLVLLQQIQPVVNAVQTLGCAVRGALGEGTESVGDLFQFSNQSTLGESEQEIIGRLRHLLEVVIGAERSARLRLLRRRRDLICDHVGRAYGILRYGRRLTSRDALGCLSALRLGVQSGMFRGVSSADVDTLFRRVQPGHLQVEVGTMASEQRDALRAQLVRHRLRDLRRGLSDDT